MRVLLDTNMLLLPHKHKIHVFDEIDRLIYEKHTYAILSNALEELKSLSGSTNDGIAANVGLKLLERLGVEVVPAEGGVDDCILEYAKENDVVVATNDAGLKKRLKKENIKVICMRGKNRLERI